MKIALIGLGHWGPRLIPTLLKHPGIDTVYGHDTDAARNLKISREFPQVTVVSKYDEILNDGEVQAVIVATPAASHFLLARRALEYGKHVLVEKPLTDAVAEATELVDLASRNDLRLMVDHITVYSGPVRALRGIIDANEPGELLYFNAVRANLGMLQLDVNVVWDLGIHEFAVLDYLIGEQPVAVSGVGLSQYGKREEIAYVTLYFENNLVAHVHVSWLSPIKMRRLIIGGRKKMVVFDDTRPQDKLEIFDSGVDVSYNEPSAHPVISYRRGVAKVLEYDKTEPLALMIDTFVSSIKDGSEPLTNGASGLRMVRILAAVEKSLKNKGRIIPIDKTAS
jgi:predicted dehydrogenase